MRKRLVTFTILVASMLVSKAQTEVTPNTDGPTMGWSSWNTYGVNISDALIRQQANAMVIKGLKAVGYEYINIDDGYFGGRDAETGQLLIHPTRFPKGLKGVVDYIHSKGLKAGIYSDAGRNTCGSKFNGDTIGRGVDSMNTTSRMPTSSSRNSGLTSLKWIIVVARGFTMMTIWYWMSVNDTQLLPKLFATQDGRMCV